MNRKICHILIATILCCFYCIKSMPVQAQQISGFNCTDYSNAVDLFEKQYYSDAEIQFKKAAEMNPDNEVLQNIIKSYRTLCAIFMEQNNSETMVMQLNEDAAFKNSKINDINFALAKQLYLAKQYKKAIPWFEKTDNKELSADNRLDCLFMQAFSCFQTGNLKQAFKLFSQIRMMPANQYTVPATYYYAHIEYSRKNYSSAISGFNEIRHDPRFSSLIAFYTLQIHAYQQKYEDVIKEGETLLQATEGDRYAEIAYLVASACFKTRKYNEALHYLNLYKSKTKQISRNDYYLEASLHYLMGQHSQALQSINAVLTVTTDSLAQSAYYYAGEIALKEGDKQQALQNFEAAGKMDFDYAIKDNARLNHAKLSLELHGDPEPLYAYHKANPQKEINRLLVAAYATTELYNKAISTILAMPRQTDKDYADIQRYAFMQAINSYDSTSYDHAIQLLNYSLTYSKYNAHLAALANYWKAEALYKKKEYEAAKKQYESLIHTVGSFNIRQEFQLAHYNIGYCDFKMKKYDSALGWFRKFINLTQNNTPHLGDAYNRIGDCYFIAQQYSLASENYNKTIQLKASHRDYAMYQKAISTGLSGKLQEKLALLDTLSAQFPESEYTPAGMYETGHTYFRINQYEQAIKALNNIIGHYPESPFYQLALIELGLIYANMEDYNKAIENYQKAILHDKNSGEAKNALAGLKNVYIELNDIEGYFTFVEQLNLVAENSDREKEKEEGRFTVAEKLYLSGECDKAVKGFQTFRKTYPDSHYTTQVNFYLGDCAFRNKQYNEAKKCFGYVMEQATNPFTEPATLGYARSAYNLDDYRDIIKSYEKLSTLTQEQDYKQEALLRIAEANFKLGNYQHTINAAERVLTLPVDEKNKTHMQLICAKSYQNIGNMNEALQRYQQLAGNVKTPEGAEAAFLTIELLYQEGRSEEAMEAIFNLADTQTPQQYWVARSFIILGDIYVVRDEIEQAKATYTSLLDGYRIQDDGIIDAAKTRLTAIK